MLVLIKRRRMLLAVAIVLMIAVGVVTFKPLSFRFRRYVCEQNMGVVYYLAVTEYGDRVYGPDVRQAYGLPAPDLKAFLQELPYSKSNMAANFVCPGTGQEPGSLEELEDWMSYIYIDWSAYFGSKAPPGDYPLLYDKSMDNHGGRGINVLRVVTGVIWDENAEWLKTFAVEHPEYEIRMPE